MRELSVESLRTSLNSIKRNTVVFVHQDWCNVLDDLKLDHPITYLLSNATPDSVYNALYSTLKSINFIVVVLRDGPLGVSPVVRSLQNEMDAIAISASNDFECKTHARVDTLNVFINGLPIGLRRKDLEEWKAAQLQPVVSESEPYTYNPPHPVFQARVARWCDFDGQDDY